MENLNENVEPAQNLNELQKRFDNWPLHQKDDAEKIKSIQLELQPRLESAIFQNPTRILEIQYHEDLEKLIGEALQTIDISEAAKANIPAEQLEMVQNHFKNTVSQIPLRSMTLEELFTPNSGNFPEFQLFVRVRTAAQVAAEQIWGWAGQSGFLGYLQQTNSVEPSYGEMRLIYYMAKYFELFSLQAAHQQEASQRFQQDNSVELFRP